MADSPLNPATLLAAFDAERTSRVSSDGARTEQDGPITRIYYPHNALIAAPSDTGLRGAELDELIARQRDHFAALGQSVEWKTYAYDQPADLIDRLAAAGYEPEERETLVVASTAALAAQPIDPAGVVIRETTDEADLIAIGALHTEVWNDDWTWIADDLRERIATLGQDGFRLLVAEADGRIVAAAWLIMRDDTEFASLWGGSTLERYRGRGIYRTLVARRAEMARAAGYPYLQVDASDMSRPILEKLGFVALTTTTPYVYQVSADGMFL
jgi:GNAT superfamily N-acetyltransferase